MGKALRHDDDYLETPDHIFNSIQEKTGLFFDTDICANEYNTKCDIFISEFDNALDPEWLHHKWGDPLWCNPPRSKNGKFFNLCKHLWEKFDYDIVILLCWNDTGNKYGKEIPDYIINGKWKIIENYGKIKFYKNGEETKFPSRLTYFSLWMKKQNNDR